MSAPWWRRLKIEDANHIPPRTANQKIRSDDHPPCPATRGSSLTSPRKAGGSNPIVTMVMTAQKTTMAAGQNSRRRMNRAMNRHGDLGSGPSAKRR